MALPKDRGGYKYVGRRKEKMKKTGNDYMHKGGFERVRCGVDEGE